jgi:hypothetical protein
MKNKLIRLLNIFLDNLNYKFCHLSKKTKNKILNLNNSNCAILCKGKSLSTFLELKNQYDYIILINFGTSFSKFPELFEKIGSTPVIILSGADEYILKYRQRKTLNVVKVYSRFTSPNIKELKKQRIRRRLEAYGLEVNSLYNIIDETVINQLQNTGLVGVYFASLYFQNISIFGLDFYTGKVEYYTKDPVSLPKNLSISVLNSHQITTLFILFLMIGM